MDERTWYQPSVALSVVRSSSPSASLPLKRMMSTVSRKALRPSESVVFLSNRSIAAVPPARSER